MAVCYLHGNMIPCIACQKYHDRAFPAMPDASTATTEKLAEGLDKLNRTLLMSPPQTEALLAESAARLRELEAENKRLHIKLRRKGSKTEALYLLHPEIF